MSRSKSGMGGSKSKSKSSGSGPHEIHIKRAHGGGFIAKHHKKKKAGQLMDEEPQEHVLADLDQLKQHMDDHMGDQPPAGQGPMEEPAPQGAPQPQMPGM
jgi:hypothetical protein